MKMGNAIKLLLLFCALVLVSEARCDDIDDLKDAFVKCAQENRLAGCIERNSTFNVESGTLGGRVFWNTCEANGWKLQINRLSQWWRILDCNDVRVARGTRLEQLRHLLNDRPTSIPMNYGDRGFRFSKNPAPVPGGRSLVLIHGWGVRAASMQALATMLSEKGFDAYNYDYPSSECSLETHVERFLECYRELAASLPASEKIYFLTHSMGGLVLRGALSKMTQQECRRITSIVMLGPPNKGSGLAYLGELPLVSALNLSLADMTPDDKSYVMNIPAPAFLPPVGIIAGRHDGKVAFDKTALPEPLPFKRIEIPSTHPGLRKPEKVLEHILHFFDTGEFAN